MYEQKIKSYRNDEEVNEDLKIMNKDHWLMDCISSGDKPMRIMGKKHPVILVGFTRWIPEKTGYTTTDEEFEKNLKKGVNENGREKETSINTDKEGD